jgi:hypothetical protein
MKYVTLFASIEPFVFPQSVARLPTVYRLQVSRGQDKRPDPFDYYSYPEL